MNSQELQAFFDDAPRPPLALRAHTGLDGPPRRARSTSRQSRVCTAAVPARSAGHAGQTAWRLAFDASEEEGRGRPEKHADKENSWAGDAEDGGER